MRLGEEKKTLKMKKNLLHQRLDDIRILGIAGFHVTQASLIITQVKNKIAYHSINSRFSLVIR